LVVISIIALAVVLATVLVLVLIPALAGPPTFADADAYLV
jgi:hypothetical protein